MLVDESEETPQILSAPGGSAPASWLSLFRDGYAPVSLMIAGGSAACALSGNMGEFLTGRMLQGLGGGFLTALAYATIRRVYRENQRTRAIVLLSGIFGAAAFTGPLFGGVLAGWGVWRWAFWIDVPLALVVGTLAASTLSKPPMVRPRG